MPINSTYNSALHRAETMATGNVTIDEILEHLDEVKEKNALCFAELIDATSTGPVVLSTSEIWTAAKKVLASCEGKKYGPRAIIVNSDVTFGMSRMFATLVSALFPIEVFRNRQDADQWLQQMMR